METEFNRFRMNPARVSVWLNIASFIIGILFYFRMEQNNERPTVIPHNPARDSVIVIDTKLHEQLKELKATQDSLMNLIKTSSEKLKDNNSAKEKIHKKISITLHTDWEQLSQETKDEYVNKTMSNLKQQSTP